MQFRVPYVSMLKLHSQPLFCLTGNYWMQQDLENQLLSGTRLPSECLPSYCLLTNTGKSASRISFCCLPRFWRVLALREIPKISILLRLFLFLVPCGALHPLGGKVFHTPLFHSVSLFQLPMVYSTRPLQIWFFPCLIDHCDNSMLLLCDLTQLLPHSCHFKPC